MKISFGEKVVPKPVARVNDADNVWGPGWHAMRREGGFVLRYQTAGHGTPDEELAIGDDEFQLLRENPASFDKLLRSHGQ